ncbi:kinase-like domain-containing protein [Mucor mucedo]|uniref:kinase-like domain-containing protein n=1 Tax=Mucor mucedo TaxID=29922 RepID=UPI00221ED9DE|nr:kinase-like domain-containing protein [Mucor mucedo]KAI7888390.1 kinase-like domain-containing protein [Mucor mucedo]
MIDLFLAYTIFPTVSLGVFVVYRATQSLGKLLGGRKEEKEPEIDKRNPNCFAALYKEHEQGQFNSVQEDFEDAPHLTIAGENPIDVNDIQSSSSDYHDTTTPSESDKQTNSTDAHMIDVTSPVDTECVHKAYAEIVEAQKYLEQLMVRFAHIIPHMESQPQAANPPPLMVAPPATNQPTSHQNEQEADTFLQENHPEEVDNVTLPQLVYNHPSVCYYKINRQLQEDRIAEIDGEVDTGDNQNPFYTPIYLDRKTSDGEEEEEEKRKWLTLPSYAQHLSILGFDSRIFRLPLPEKEFKAEMAIATYFANKENTQAKLTRPWTTEGEPHFSRYIDISPQDLHCFHLYHLALLRMVSDSYAKGEMRDYITLFDKKLGSGMNGQVLLGEFKDESIYADHVAVKSLSSYQPHSIFDAYLIVQEAYVMTRHPHQNIIRGIKVFCSQLGQPTIAMELMDCSLFEFINLHYVLRGVPKKIPVDIVVYIFHNKKIVQIVNGLGHLLDIFGLFHGDIKPENILMHENGSIKISDFGLCKRAGRRHPGGTGTTMYMAPEVASKIVNCYEKSDIWSLGILLLFLLDITPPYYHQFTFSTKTEKKRYLAEGTFNYEPTREIHAKFQSLIARMFILDPAQRIGLSELKSDLEVLIRAKTIPCCTQDQFSDYYRMRTSGSE